MSSNGNKVTASIAGATVVTAVAIGAGAATGQVVVVALPSITAFFGFLGGLVMGKVLA